MIIQRAEAHAERLLAHRKRAEAQRARDGNPIGRYNWLMFGAVWLLQYVNPTHIERDHLYQLLGELGISEEHKTGIFSDFEKF